MSHLWQDIRFAARTLQKNIGFTVVVVLTLALGIGANATIFTVINAVLLQSLPYPEADRIAVLQESNLGKGLATFSFSPPNYLDWRAQNHVFENMAAFNQGGYTYTGGDAPEQLSDLEVAGGFFEILRARPLIGRTFTAEEFQPGKDHDVILSYGFWQRSFGGDLNAVGKTIALDGASYTIVGVMPATFSFGGRRTQFFAPLTFPPEYLKARGAHYLDVIARLKPGVSMDQARADVSGIAANLAKEYPRTNAGWGAVLQPLRDSIVGEIRPALLILAGAVGLVLLIACVNVANMLLVRSTSRRQEIAIRSAMGASRARLISQLLTESALLSFAGGALALVFAYLGARALIAVNPGIIPRAQSIHMDSHVLGFTFLLSILTGLAFGLIPAFSAARTNLQDALREGGRTGAGVARRRLRGALVAAEVALALMLLICAGLLIQSFSRLTAVSPGFRIDHGLTLMVSIPQAKYPQPAQQASFFDQLLEKISALPGVQSAAASGVVPMTGNGLIFSFRIEGVTEPPEAQQPSAAYFLVTPGYLQTMGISLLSGRDFSRQDSPDSKRVCLINDVLARQFFPGRNPIGQQMHIGRKDAIAREIIGVVSSVKPDELSQKDRPQIYEPFDQAPDNAMTFVLRVAGDPMSQVGAVRQAVQSLDSQIAVVDPRTLEDLVSESTALPRFRTLLLGLFAALALLLASVGLYGVMSYSVAQRTHEMGVRMALGAQPRQILLLVVREGMTLVAAGIAVGIAGAMFLSRVLENLLFGIGPRDTVTIVSVAFFLALIALLACYLPARRATEVDPLVALRYE